MKLHYDTSLKFVGLGIVPWTRLGLEQYFDKYSIVSLLPWDLPNSVGNLTVEPLGIELEKRNTQSLMELDKFKGIINARHKDCMLIPYKPVQPLSWLPGSRIVQTDASYSATYENKRIFREYFHSSIPFAPFKVFARADLQATNESFVACTDGQSVVLQDEVLSGGRGTFIIETYEDYVTAIKNLSLQDSGEYVVVSELIKGAQERSVQCCITKDKVYIGPLQTQLVREPLLCDPLSLQGDKFCGAEILDKSDVSQNVLNEVKKISQIIGERARSDGYRGIFGIDMLIKDDETYALEVNARTTGVTPLLTMLGDPQKDTPFYLLHVLELGGAEYSVEATAALPADKQFSRSGSMLILHARQGEAGYVHHSHASGIYEFRDSNLTFLRSSHWLENEGYGQNHVLVQQWAPIGSEVRDGGRLLTVYTTFPVLNKEKKLSSVGTRLIQELYSGIDINIEKL